MDSALVASVDDLKRNLDMGSASLLILLDFSEVFNFIDYCILQDCLSNLELGRTRLQWLCSYLWSLSYRILKKVVLGDCCTSP